MTIRHTTLLALSFLLVACQERNDSGETTIIEEPVPLSCAALGDREFPNTRIASAETVAAGTFTPPTQGFGRSGTDYSTLPEFCRIIGSIHPTSDSDIGFELWLPAENWNGRFIQTGNGGVAGSIVHGSMAGPLRRGYAVANTDTGHVSGGNDIWGWAVGHTSKLTDYAWRAVHELTTTGKAITATRYGTDPEKSYFVGCSTGGRQGLMEAQRFPEDYDAIIAGAPAANWAPLMALSVLIQTNLGPGKLDPTKLRLLKEGAIAACDALDGVEDRVISSIRQCDFDPASLQCQGNTTVQCLAPREVDAARTIYAGVVGDDGTQWFPGTGPGSELLWAPYATPQFSLGTGYFRDILLKDADWRPESFNADSLMPLAMEGSAELMAMDPDISAYLDNGGKLITYHGTTDGLISYDNTVNYVDAMIETLGESAVEEAVRFYLVPGMDHCAGGEGAHAIDWLGAMEQWVEQGQAPGTLTGIHPAPAPAILGTENRENTPGEFTRPICKYPEVAVYQGTGDVWDASSFSCR